MEIVKTYDLKNLKEIVSKEISVGLSSGRDHARINLISAQEISEILAECMVREERLKRMFENITKETDRNVCALDENLSPVFVEKEHPETEMLEKDLEHLYEVVKDKDRELEELRRHLENLKETISDKNEQLNILISENSELEKENEELKEKYKALTDVHYVGKEECEEEQNDCDCVKLPSCYGNFDLANIDCLKCKEKEYCLSEKEEQTKEETINV